ncbi:MAG: ankyrin repeat domain-containing protein [Akkermansia sp.]|nr:ankyrin repeat domain-containing protein [Akkermansia sp.]
MKKNALVYMCCVLACWSGVSAAEQKAALMECAWSGELPELQKLVRAGADVNAANERGDTALMRAAQRGRLDMVQVLLAADANPNAQDKRGWTALMGTCVSKYTRNTAIARALVAAGAQLELKNKQGFTALSYAAQSDKYDHVEYLLAAGADVNSEDGYGRSVLMRAVECKASVALLQLLLDKGANARQVNKTGVGGTLTAAVKTKNVEILRMMLQAGADVTGACGSRALEMAVSYAGNPEMVRLLLEAGVNPNSAYTNPLYLAVCTQQNTQCAELLLAAGADVNARVALGQLQAPPLFGAVGYPRKDAFLHLLIAHGADVNARDKSGNTPFLTAAKRGYGSYLRILLEAGADPLLVNDEGLGALALLTDIENTQLQLTEEGYTRLVRSLKAVLAAEPSQRLAVWDAEWALGAQLPGGVNEASSYTGRTPLMQAADRLDTERIKQLLASGAEVNRQDAWGNTALMYAQTPAKLNSRGEQWDWAWKKEAVEPIALLLQAGALVNAQNHAGETALMLARNNAAQVEALLHAGADVKLTDARGYTALHRAAYMRDSMVFELLLAADAEVDVRTPDGATPLMLAAGRNDAPQLRCFVTAGADVNARDNAGKTVLDYARTQGVVDYLRSLGAKKSAELR